MGMICSPETWQVEKVEGGRDRNLQLSDKQLKISSRRQGWESDAIYLEHLPSW